MKNCKQYWIFSKNWRQVFLTAFFVILLGLPLEISRACGPFDHSFHGYSFINENILIQADREALGPLFEGFDKLYANFFELREKANQNDNLKEWYERFCKLVKKEDLAQIIYTASITDLELLLTNMRSKTLPVPVRLRGNTFAEYVWDEKCDDTVEYLIYAKQCEPHVTLNDQWDRPKRDVAAMESLIESGQRHFRKTKSAYIRLRYVYQIVRLAHYAGLYEEALELYGELLPKVDKLESGYSESIITWWIEGHRAGALMALGDRVTASYLYSQIFRHCPGRRISAYQSFSIRTNEEWEAALRLGQSDAERAMLYVIRASNPKSRALEEMQAIYRLDPENPQLEVLLFKEIRKLERNLLGLKFNNHQAENKRYHGLPEKGIGDYLIAVQAFARQLREERKVVRPVFWRIAEGYLEFLAGDFYAAEKTYREAAREVDDKLLKEQLQAFRLALQIASFKHPTPQVEAVAYDIMKEEEFYKKYASFPDYLRDKMTWLYNKAGLEAKAFLCQHTIDELKPNPVPDMVDELLAVKLKKDPTLFERMLTETFSAEDLLDMKAVYLMSQGQIEAALETYRRIPATQWDNYGQYNPFRETMKDRVNVVRRSDSLSLSSYLNRGELIEALLDLEFKARGEIELSARHYYRLGLAYYNMSFYGYEWKAMDYFRSGSTWSKLNRGIRGVYPHWQYELNNRENTDVSRALFFFEKAHLLAKTDELKAKAAFQAARCEQKLYFTNENYRPEPCCNRIPCLPEEYLVNFNRLKENYAHTQFFEQIIGECKYFEVYVRN